MINNKELLKQLSKNSLIHLILENEVRTTPFGQITFTVEIRNGMAQIETLNVVKNKRIKYSDKNLT